MKKVFILLSFILTIGCSSEIQELEKPFVIIFKFPRSLNCNEGFCSYHYIDKNGIKNEFCEDEKKYCIGDTIK